MWQEYSLIAAFTALWVGLFVSSASYEPTPTTLFSTCYITILQVVCGVLIFSVAISAFILTGLIHFILRGIGHRLVLVAYIGSIIFLSGSFLVFRTQFGDPKKDVISWIGIFANIIGASGVAVWMFKYEYSFFKTMTSRSLMLLGIVSLLTLFALNTFGPRTCSDTRPWFALKLSVMSVGICLMLSSYVSQKLVNDRLKREKNMEKANKEGVGISVVFQVDYFTKEQADYIGVPVSGPYKPSEYRY